MRYGMMLVASVSVLAFAAIGRAEEPRAGQVISLDVLLADVAAATAGDEEVTASRILELEKQGKLDRGTRIKLSLIENQPGSVQFGERVPVITGQQSGFGGRGSSATHTVQNLGTSVQATTRVEQDGAILIELTVERTQLPPTKAKADGDAAAEFEPARVSQITARTNLRVASGKPVIVSGQSTAGKDAAHTYIVLTASAADGAKTAAASEAMIKILTLNHARAADMVKVLRPILGDQRIAITADERSNSLVLQGSRELLEITRALVARLDES